MACRLFGAMPLSEPMLDYHWLSINRGHFASAPMMSIVFFGSVIMIYRTARLKSSKFRHFIYVCVDLGCVDNIFVAIDDSDQIIHLVWWLILTSVIHMVLLYVLSEHVDRPTYSVSLRTWFQDAAPTCGWLFTCPYLLYWPLEWLVKTNYH